LTTLGPIKRKKKFKLDTLQMVICWDIYCPKMAAFQKTKLKKKRKYITGAGKQKQY